MRRLLHILMIFCLILGFFLGKLKAQDNPFKIDNDLYSYYQRCEVSIKDRKVLAMADTLFNMAKRKNDVKAQCLAKNLKGDYYFFAGDIKNLLKEKDNIISFAVETPFQQYVFSPWNRVISYYTTHDMRDEALQEIQKYQREAIRLNNAYGIGNSYKKFSDIYTLNGQGDLALKELLKGLDYYERTGKKEEIFNFYSYIGNCYLNMNKLELAKQYYLQALGNAPVESFKGPYYIVLASLYLDTNNIEETQKYIALLNKWKQKYKLSFLTKEKENRFYARWYCHEKEYDKALTYCETLSPMNKYLTKIKIFESSGKIDSAYRNSVLYYDYRMKQINEEQQQILAKNVAKFDNARLENEKNVLSLKNARLQLEQLNTKERLLAADKEKNLLALNNTRLELNNKNLALDRQQAEVNRQRAEANKQIALKLSAQRQAHSEKVFNWTVTMLLLLISLGLFTYAFQRHRAARRLQKEVLRTTKARNEAEESRIEAEKARREAENANKMKSLFLQNMSHEIRTPLNAIVGFSNVLSDPSIELGADEKTEFSKLVQDNGSLLTNLINDILDISKLESGNYELRLSNDSVVSICRKALASVRERVPLGVQMIFVPYEKDIEIKTDPLRVQQLLINFLTNACKYTEKGSITLAFEVNDTQVIFSVTDTGTGIDPENAERIFDRFEKLDQFKQGTGLGLNICRSIADLLHGEVTLDTTYTKGARFLFIHPLNL